jgi:steroid delta-isomerase-like uncharacterized protein
MSLADNKNVVSRFLEEVMNKGNQAVGDQLVATGFVDHSPMPGFSPDATGFKKGLAAVRAAIPDMKYTIEDIIAEGDKVVARWRASGTHKGEMFGIPPTGKSTTVTGMDIFRVANGKLVEFWLNWDQLGMLQQLGAIPPR